VSEAAEARATAAARRDLKAGRDRFYRYRWDGDVPGWHIPALPPCAVAQVRAETLRGTRPMPGAWLGEGRAQTRCEAAASHYAYRYNRTVLLARPGLRAALCAGEPPMR
jgi:hypothetical protein